jgi:hypothetical protein
MPISSTILSLADLSEGYNALACVAKATINQDIASCIVQIHLEENPKHIYQTPYYHDWKHAINVGKLASKRLNELIHLLPVGQRPTDAEITRLSLGIYNYSLWHDLQHRTDRINTPNYTFDASTRLEEILSYSLEYMCAEPLTDGTLRSVYTVSRLQDHSINTCHISPESYSAICLIREMQAFNLTKNKTIFTPEDMQLAHAVIVGGTYVEFSHGTFISPFLRQRLSGGQLGLDIYNDFETSHILQASDPNLIEVLMLLAMSDGDIGSATSDPDEFIKSSISYAFEQFFVQKPGMIEKFKHWNDLSQEIKNLLSNQFMTYFFQHIDNQIDFAKGRIAAKRQENLCLAKLPSLQEFMTNTHAYGGTSIEYLKRLKLQISNFSFEELLDFLASSNFLVKIN